MSVRKTVGWRYLLAASALALAGCGPADDLARAKAAAPPVQGPTQVGQSGLRKDGPGCQDKAEAAKLVAASKKEDQAEYIKLWSDGMQDQRCRGFSEGLGVTVKEKDAEGWACITPADDATNPRCFWVEPGRAG